MKRGGGARGRGFKPWLRKGVSGGSNFKSKPLLSRVVRQTDDGGEQNSTEDHSFTIKLEPGCPYNSWKLYFPTKKFSQSQDINKRITTMKKHFEDYPHWYDLDKVTSCYVLDLRVENFVDDKEIEKTWATWYQDIFNDPIDSLAAIALAMHITIENDLKKKENHLFMKKIFVRPYGWRPITKLADVFESENQLISTSGVVKSIEPIEACAKYLCFKCPTCSSELCVQQVSSDGRFTKPSTCSKGCKTKSKFIPLMSSPYTLIAPRQKILIQDICYIKEEATPSLEIELTEDQVGIVSVGSQLIITGIVKHTNERQKSMFQAKSFKPYFQSISVTCPLGLDVEMYQAIQNNSIPDIVDELRAEPNIFKILVHSLCPDVYGREEAKAALILGLLSGNDLLKSRRSSSHIMLLGNPGTGKSKMLMSAASVSSRGMFVCGTLVTATGLTVGISSRGAVEAGALVLSDNGACCVDEFDKTGTNQTILLEVMEQQTISIAKCGAVISVPARGSLLVAANPTGCVYDRSKTVLQNLKIPQQLVSRFDLIIPFAENLQMNNRQFTDFMNNRSRTAKASISRDAKFFDSSQSSINAQSNHWLKLDSDEKFEPISHKNMRDYIEYVRQCHHPKLSKESLQEIKLFFKEYLELCGSSDLLNTYGSSRFLESVIRLTLSRARAEMAEEATVQHAKEIISIVKYSLIDIYKEYDVDETNGKTESKFPLIVRKKANESVSTMSKPKQMKAFMEFLSDKCDEEDRIIFKTSEIKDFAKELGIKDLEDIIYRLNNEGSILKTSDGYRIVRI